MRSSTEGIECIRIFGGKRRNDHADINPFSTMTHFHIHST
ncbi:hypothetical protein E2C01_014408 [Portunus trituberculatus]|uniref:Uncharacterized protein n=1 Tax=Portunus trituberculatus TaxID=210409 RepID=A0A5B7DIR0_PORTR|nr:hypothetical protein [Portunus trituberculatus]